MNNKRTPLEKEEPKHKKKSKGSGLPRSKHKHEYTPVLLHRPYTFTLNETKTDLLQSVNMVCKICGRIDYTIQTDEYYDTEYKIMGKYRIRKIRLNKKALALPKWYTHDYWDKFAYREEKD